MFNMMLYLRKWRKAVDENYVRFVQFMQELIDYRDYYEAYFSWL